MANINYTGQRVVGNIGESQSANQHERLVSKTAEERTARLQQMSANQHERLVSETAEQREARLQSFEGYISCAFPTLFPTGAADFVLPIMSPYRLPHGQYAYNGHVMNLP